MGEPSGTWSISIACDTGRIPAAVLRQVLGQLEEMGRALQLIEPGNLFWTSVRESGMRLDVDGWRFHFRVGTERAVLTKVEPASIA